MTQGATLAPWPRGPGGPHRPGVQPPVHGGSSATAPLPLPVVLAIGVSGLTQTSVTLVGSINTQGLAGSWWFVWGTTPSFGNVTASANASASALPLTVSAGLTGLVSGQTYYFALVGRTAAGTVTSTTLSFMAQAPVSPSTVSSAVPSPLISSLTIPHFAWPFKIKYGTPHVSSQGGQVISHDGAAVVQQDSDGDVTACVTAVTSCTVGEWPESPGFGISDLAFRQLPLEIDGLATEIVRWEPRAALDVRALPTNDMAPTTLANPGAIRLSNDDGTWTIQVDVSTA